MSEAMTGPEFADALAQHGLSQSGFARWLNEHGHPARGLDRTVRRWVRNGPPGEVVVILRLLEREARLLRLD